LASGLSDRRAIALRVADRSARRHQLADLAFTLVRIEVRIAQPPKATAHEK
jgi:hypothetical protein